MTRRAFVQIQGRVQGVGFRYSVLSRARSLELTGWVRNRPDGSVEAAFEGDDEAYRSMRERLVVAVEPLVAGGADVVIPAGALSGLLLRRERGLTIGHAPVVNCVAVGLASAEAWVRLRDSTGLEPSRGPSFALAPPGAVEDFRAFVRDGRPRES